MTTYRDVRAQSFGAHPSVGADGGPMTDTPKRMAQAYAEMLTPRPFELATFPNDEGYDELVRARRSTGAIARTPRSTTSPPAASAWTRPCTSSLPRTSPRHAT